MEKFTSDKIESFITTLLSAEKCLTYEFSTPASFSLDEICENLKGREFLRQIGAFVCTDSPLGRLKHSAPFASLKLQNLFGIPSITTVSMRDRNTLALQSELMGMNSLDLRLILALTGDPLRLGNQPQAKGVFEGNSQLLLKIIDSLNQCKDINGEGLQGKYQRIYPFCVMNSYAKNKEVLYKKMQDKICGGALALFTQPIYDVNLAEELLLWCHKINEEYQTHCVLVFGFFPIFSYKTAQFLHNRLPGVFVPKEWLSALEEANKVGNEMQVGMQKSQKLFCKLLSLHNKFHLMSANKPDCIEKILS